jgi:hypothetical protein
MSRNGKYDTQAAIQLIRKRGRIQEAREDTTALLLCKLESIVRDNDVPIRMMMDEISQDPKRAEQVMHSLIGLIVQYSEAAAGFLPLCGYLAETLGDDPLPGLTEVKWTK